MDETPDDRPRRSSLPIASDDTALGTEFEAVVTRALAAEHHPAADRRAEIYARALSLHEREWNARSILPLPEAWLVERRVLEEVIARIEARAAEFDLLEHLAATARDHAPRGPATGAAEAARDRAEQEAATPAPRRRSGIAAAIAVVAVLIVLIVGALVAFDLLLWFGTPADDTPLTPAETRIRRSSETTVPAPAPAPASPLAVDARWLTLVRPPCSNESELATLEVVQCNNASRPASDAPIEEASWFHRGLLLALPSVVALPDSLRQEWEPAAFGASTRASTVPAEQADLQVLLLRGRGLLRANDAAGAEKAFGDAIAIDPLSVQAYLNRSSARIRLNNYAGAIADLDRALEQQNDNGPAFRARALLLTHQGNAAAALQDFSRAIELARADPTSMSVADLYDALRRRAALYDLQRNYQAEISDLEAMIDMTTAAEVDSGVPMGPAAMNALLLQRGILFSRQRIYDKAQADFTRVIEARDERAVAALIERARAFEAQGRIEQATEDLKTALVLDGTNREARALLDRLQRR